MGLFKYYGRLFRVAFTHSFGLAQNLIFLLFILFGFQAWAGKKESWPVGAMIPDVTGWQVAVLVLGTIFAVRLLCAP